MINFPLFLEGLLIPLVFLGFFAIMNPIANTAVFVALAGHEEKNVQKKIAFKALIISFFVIVLFAILGKTIFQVFGITISALRITGGVLVFIIGYHMLHGEGSRLHKHKEGESDDQNEDEDEDLTDIAVTPLAVPILAGPGTIATAMNYSVEGGWTEIVVTISGFGILCLVTFICFIFGQKILVFFGESGVAIVTRIMGLILATIGVEMLLEGLMEIVGRNKEFFL